MLLVQILLLACFGNAQTPAHQTITIRLLNGKTGKPYWWRGLASACVGSAIQDENACCVDKRTNFRGEAKIEVGSANPRQIRVGADFISRDCRVNLDAPATPPNYSIDEIRAKGIVSENYCGGPKRDPRPGVLIIYVIPSTMRELWHQ